LQQELQTQRGHEAAPVAALRIRDVLSAGDENETSIGKNKQYGNGRTTTDTKEIQARAAKLKLENILSPFNFVIIGGILMH
jgi:hypothetical protein